MILLLPVFTDLYLSVWLEYPKPPLTNGLLFGEICNFSFKTITQNCKFCGLCKM